MKVSELIILLLDCNPEAEVGYYETDGYDNCYWRDIKEVLEFDERVEL